MSFLLFTILFLGLIAAHFALAGRAWRRLRGVYSSEIDLNYSRRESYFADSFRAKIMGWLHAPVVEQGLGYRILDNGGERIVALTSDEDVERAGASEVYVVSGDLRTQTGAVFQKEIFVNGDARFANGARVQAVTAEGGLELGPHAVVNRWADSDEQMTIATGAVIHSRATSRTAIHFAGGAQAKSLFAPRVTTDSYDGSVFDRSRVPAPRALRLPLVKGGVEDTQGLRQFNGLGLISMGEDTLLCRGDLHLNLPVELRMKLIVTGSFSCPGGSLISHDVKAGGDLRIGPGSLVEGNLVAGQRLEMGAGSQFEGVLHAGTNLLLERGVRGAARRQAVAAYATGDLFVETDVMVEGKLAAGGWVRSVRPYR